MFCLILVFLIVFPQLSQETSLTFLCPMAWKFVLYKFLYPLCVLVVDSMVIIVIQMFYRQLLLYNICFNLVFVSSRMREFSSSCFYIEHFKRFSIFSWYILLEVLKDFKLIKKIIWYLNNDNFACIYEEDIPQ